MDSQDVRSTLGKLAVAGKIASEIPPMTFGCLINRLQHGGDIAHQYERWLDIESSVDARSTFFFAPDKSNIPHITDPNYRYNDSVIFDGERMTVADMISEIDRRGWEIGLHPTVNAHDNTAEMNSQKSQVEDLVGHDIVSVRHHRLHFDIRKTPNVLSAVGFQYDSSIGFKGGCGFRYGTSYPWPLGATDSVLEIPLAYSDGDVDEGLLDSAMDEVVTDIMEIATRVKRVNGVFTLLWHPFTISDERYIDLYEQVLQQLEKMGAWLTSVNEIGNWWKTQNAGLSNVEMVA
jgi:peptidoglycan/xylan/chitin deacetylase (PgdA/CDA1 family)